ncbi:hypothetical protein [Paenibacillus beijingensis]|uniref:Uncharacterized protein n=1 Tax=Paenibacillus beijingensis TaxID=1126833 RepID=A0A0D5NJ53_9BACL|nr:hypothetical protein [Paenibacillus beijingensis]AJY75027.1 hypothetical protein VN24_11115 [Paenibacillus beijingensis]
MAESGGSDKSRAEDSAEGGGAGKGCFNTQLTAGSVNPELPVLFATAAGNRPGCRLSMNVAVNNAGFSEVQVLKRLKGLCAKEDRDPAHAEHCLTILCPFGT